MANKKYIGYHAVCDCCGKPMNVGYVIEYGVNFYCSDICKDIVISDVEWEELYDEGYGDSYYTEWEDPSDANYIIVDGKPVYIWDDPKYKNLSHDPHKKIKMGT